MGEDVVSVAVIGAGSWGTALSQVLASKGNDVRLWARREDVVQSINEAHRNPRYLSDSVLCEGIHATSSHEEALAGAQAVLVTTPSVALDEVGRFLAPFITEDVPVVICSKGIDESGMFPVDVLGEALGNPSRIAVLSGPNHAEEVIEAIPSATVIASEDPATARFFRDLLATEALRTYTSEDVVGVELCGALKNVIAIAVGLGYGIGFGDNTAALLITRGLAEMSRIVVACGGQALTCMGLAGAGDMVVTCMSQHSRNRRFGEFYLAKGKSLADFEADTHMVVEGARACRTLEVLSDRHGIDLPITDTVRDIIWSGLSLSEAVHRLSDRPLTEEFYGL